MFGLSVPSILLSNCSNVFRILDLSTFDINDVDLFM